MTRRDELLQDFKNFLEKGGVSPTNAIDREISHTLSVRYTAPIDKFFITSKHGWSLRLSVEEAEDLRNFIDSMLEEAQ